jgi:hypothetical protein
MSDKNFADVASEGIAQLSGGIGDLSEKITEAVGTIESKLSAAASEVSRAAPGMWRLAVKEQLTEGILDIVTAVILLALVAFCNLFLFDVFISNQGGLVFCHIVSVVIGPLAALGYAYSGTHRALNSEYYAAAKLAKAMRGR